MEKQKKVLQNSKTRGMPQANFSTWPVMKKIQYKEKIYRIMAQIANCLHVKNHALWASDYAIKLINKMYPNNFDEVKKEREIQIALMKSV
jgi:hypothetical protein